MDETAKQSETSGSDGGYDTDRIEDEVVIVEDPDGLDESDNEDEDLDEDEDVPFADGRDDFDDTADDD